MTPTHNKTMNSISRQLLMTKGYLKSSNKVLLIDIHFQREMHFMSKILTDMRKGGADGDICLECQPRMKIFSVYLGCIII